MSHYTRPTLFASPSQVASSSMPRPVGLGSTPTSHLGTVVVVASGGDLSKQHATMKASTSARSGHLAPLAQDTLQLSRKHEQATLPAPKQSVWNRLFST
jgi:hypothetical protein